MKILSFVFKTDKSSIDYQIDAEARSYIVRTFGADGKMVSETEAEHIADPQKLSKKLYLLVQAALVEGANAGK